MRTHYPVLLHEVIDILEVKSDDTILDGTVGLGGHARQLAKGLGSQGLYIALDLDREALRAAKEVLSDISTEVIVRQGNFCRAPDILSEIGISSVDKIILDLGMRTDQLTHSGRGFSFKRHEPLLMTFAQDAGEEQLTADDIVNTWQAENIETIIANYGEERYARRIAEAIIKARQDETIQYSDQLAEIIKQAVPAKYRGGKIHPATRTFQALRITVNDELQSLRDGLDSLWNLLTKQGRLAVITFHSLEDHLVKKTFKRWQDENQAKLLTKKPITPNDEEIHQNPASRSAKLRACQKIG